MTTMTKVIEFCPLFVVLGTLCVGQGCGIELELGIELARTRFKLPNSESNSNSREPKAELDRNRVQNRVQDRFFKVYRDRGNLRKNNFVELVLKEIYLFFK